MALTIKDLIQKNKDAHNKHFYIESVFLSYNLIGKVLRQVLQQEKITTTKNKPKLSEYIKAVRSHYDSSPIFSKKIKRSVLKSIHDFNSDFKSLNKELKYQYPESKLKTTSQKGINALVLLHTSAVKLRSNRKNQNL
jgi:hypothetical protein